MGKFAKLYEVEEDQVLIKLAMSSDGYPSVHFITEVEGTEIIVGPTFGPKNAEESFDLNAAWSVAERYFDEIDIERAVAARTGIVKMLSDQAEEQASV